MYLFSFGALRHGVGSRILDAKRGNVECYVKTGQHLFHATVDWGPDAERSDEKRDDD